MFLKCSPQPINPQSKLRGFTLIELSIVLVIIGLIVGGVLVGRDLIKASEIRAQISQIEEFKTATNTFKLKYGYLPGDMPPSQTSQLGFFTFTGTYAGKNCVLNGFGDNNGSISWYTYQGEIYAFWAHLSSAGLIKGAYGNIASNPINSVTTVCWGVGGAGSPTSVANESEFALFVPKSKFANNAYVFVLGNYFMTPEAGVRYYNDTGGKINMFSIASYVQNTSGYDIVISAYQAYQVDSKIDDAMPTSGSVRVNNSSNNMFRDGSIVASPPCTTSGASPLQYDMTESTQNNIGCKLDFLF